MTAVLLLDGKANAVCCETVSRGSAGAVCPNLRGIIEKALLCSAKGCIIVHNHPNGSDEPSNEDIFTANRINRIMAELEIPLYEHYIIAKGKLVRISEFGRPRG